MSPSPLAFHAAAPQQWINDPNGLVHADGAYRLFAQHSTGPEDRRIGWCRFSSPDLLRWTCDGAVIPPVDDAWMYSGSVVADQGSMEAFHTLHEGRHERQVLRFSADAGASWSAPESIPSLGPPAPNRRDPFVFRDGSGWVLLLAEPCDWTDWPGEPASRLRLFRSEDRRDWREAGTIGPWRPRGIMWEVPLLVRIDGRDVLILSEVDRRGDAAACSVRAWIGTMHADGFTCAAGIPPEGQRLDHGPDFYALMASSGDGWPAPEQLFVAWASSWSNARLRRWPGFHGGPISLPRTLSVDGDVPRLRMHPAPNLVRRFSRSSEAQPQAGLGRLAWRSGALLVEASNDSSRAEIGLDREAGRIGVSREGGDHLSWRHDQEVRFAESADVSIFVDGPLLELFAGGIASTLALEGDGSATRVSVWQDERPTPVDWTVLD